ncbi:hypothetical protein JR316_0001979 [Psilocybe cubensis]|uniref:CUE domain-containing protein n=2 Tax=Psilocybe cubensis TaxID=181762 RepID=A0A8H8CN23_PSICU|nr:hypothetical protein JR316_0001979 [Psilocybe cubensis]KAH9485073.1 hypothetical protein JR316_0001979 [Psilocybe cubensis]
MTLNALPEAAPVTMASPPTQPPSPPRDTVVDPRVVALRAMFPDYDDLILQSVLESASGNQDRAVDILLGMTDPEFKSEAPQQPPPQPLSQTELDEQFARQLVMQEQQQETQHWLAQQQQQRPPAIRRSSSRSAASPQHQEGQDRPSELQEQFTKIAETGKKTFGNIFSKVKAKLQELETGRPANTQPAPSASQPYQTYHPHSQAHTQTPQQQAPYFDPSSDRAVQAMPTPATSTSPPSSSPPPSQQLQPQAQPQLTTNAVPPPPATSQGAPIDGGKLGLMPKRPVSLIREPNAQPAAGSGSGSQQQRSLLDDDDDDGLEYAENPFDDHTATGKK